MTKTPDRARLVAMQRHFYTATSHSWPATVVGATATSVDGETAIADSLVEGFKDGFLLSRGVLHPSPLCCGCLSATDIDFDRPDSVCTPQLNGWLAPAQWHIVRVSSECTRPRIVLLTAMDWLLPWPRDHALILCGAWQFAEIPGHRGDGQGCRPFVVSWSGVCPPDLGGEEASSGPDDGLLCQLLAGVHDDLVDRLVRLLHTT